MRRLARRRAGFSLLELLLVLLLVGTTWSVSYVAYRAYRRATVLRASRGAVVAFLARARLAAVSRREVLRLRIGPDGDLTLRAPDGELLDRLPLTTGDLALDSVRLAPRTLRFNPRGQGAPGSAYLFAGERGVRVVCNFLGRLRVERFRL